MESEEMNVVAVLGRALLGALSLLGTGCESIAAPPPDSSALLFVVAASASLLPPEPFALSLTTKTTPSAASGEAKVLSFAVLFASVIDMSVSVAAEVVEKVDCVLVMSLILVVLVLVMVVVRRWYTSRACIDQNASLKASGFFETNSSHVPSACGQLDLKVGPA
jgi:hypothetical protein